ncbi:M14 family metallopeptidase [Anaerosporobacter faecicola]|uniref:M14 family metallopeptidase n=1 Tax=Anaerosporobacter faecicola TaxID=2718714 RepID=UPI00143CB431|nr:M14 family metallopeptidase [Anaerosporobacter faecicola]
MIKDIISVGLPVVESMDIKKNRLLPLTLNGKEKRICIVTGIHGDELEGQFVCYEMIRRINANLQYLNGIVDIYPYVNPLGLESITRRVPTFDLDMNRNFPGNEEGDMAECVAATIIEDILGSDLCIDLHASNIFIREIPQVRISADHVDTLLQYSKLLNVDFVWVNDSVTILKSSLVHSLNSLGVPSLAVEMGVGMRLTKEYGLQLVDGLFNLMKELGIWSGPVAEIREPIVSTDGQVQMIHAEASGIFVPAISHWKGICKGDCVGDIIDSLNGTIKEHILAPCSGTVFTLREYPVVYNGSLIARILGGTSTC